MGGTGSSCEATSGDRTVVVGAGLLGLAVGELLSRGGREVVVVDKEPMVAAHQSGHNSGVVHSGIYYEPGSLKATLCRRGVALLRAYCAEHRIAYREIGKVIVARDASEIPRLDELERRAGVNGVPDVRRLDRFGLREIEPEVEGVAALHSPTTAIVDYPAVARSLAAGIESRGGRVLLGRRVEGVRQEAAAVRVLTTGGELTGDRVVLCAGLHADVLAVAAGDERAPMIVPFRGEYFRLRPDRAHLVNGLVYPVPDPAYPFLGVHITPRVDGHVDIGPNAVLATATEGYRKRDVDLRELWQVLSWPGARRLFGRHWRAGLREMRGSISEAAYLSQARAYLPSLRREDVERAPAGVRAQAVDLDGSLVDDFRIHHLGRVVAVRNAPSPAATSSLAIAEHVVAELERQRPA